MAGNSNSGTHTKFKAEFIKKIDEYLISQQDIYNDKKELQEVKLPTIKHFLSLIDIEEATLSSWREKIKKYQLLTEEEKQKITAKKRKILENKIIFVKSLEKIKVEQEQRVLNASLCNKYNSTIAKLVLHNHGYSEKQEVKQENTGQVDNNINIKFVD
jgi:hypothetical protein